MNPENSNISISNSLNQEIQRQIEFLENELAAVKMRYNSAGFICTSAPAILARQYRDSIKKHLKVLRVNLES